MNRSKRPLVWLLLAAQILSVCVPAYASDEHWGRLQWVCCCLDAHGKCPSENGGQLRLCCVPVAASAGMASGDLAAPGSADLQADSQDQPSAPPSFEVFVASSQPVSELQQSDDLAVSALQRYLYLNTGRLRL